MTDRHTIDTINSDQLDQLYERLAAAEKENTELRDALAHCPEREPRQRAEAAIARIQALADDHPAGVDTALIHEALDQTPRTTLNNPPTSKDK
ncbi:hypothetical protein ACWGJ6_23395 [Streptomyces canus]